MRLVRGDTVRLKKGNSTDIGIVERRSANEVVVRWPADDNRRTPVRRDEVEALAEAMARARRVGSKFSNSLSLTGGSNVADLVEAFGYATGQLRTESTQKVINQLSRAGVDVLTDAGLLGREAFFSLELVDDESTERDEIDDAEEGTAARSKVKLPEESWPAIFGLDPRREISLLRALGSRDPLLCLLHLPAGDAQDLRQGWEALLGWAHRCAQRFLRSEYGEHRPSFHVANGSALSSYFASSAISGDFPRLRDEARALNVAAVEAEQSLPSDIDRLRAAWPGQVFEFRPTAARLSPAQVTGLYKSRSRSVSSAVPMLRQLSPRRTSRRPDVRRRRPVILRLNFSWTSA